MAPEKRRRGRPRKDAPDTAQEATERATEDAQAPETTVAEEQPVKPEEEREIPTSAPITEESGPATLPAEGDLPPENVIREDAASRVADPDPQPPASRISETDGADFVHMERDVEIVQFRVSISPYSRGEISGMEAKRARLMERRGQVRIFASKEEAEKAEQEWRETGVIPR